MRGFIRVAVVLIIVVAGYYLFMKNEKVKVIPIAHASVVFTFGDTVVYADPVGSASAYAALEKPDIVLITHEHGDHFSLPTLTEIMDAETTLIVPQSVADKLPDTVKQKIVVIKNGNSSDQSGLSILAIPMYNLREEDKDRHPQGAGNGYVLEGSGKRVYIAGDTEDIPEMRALKDIDIAFVPMNLPYTMSVEKAADGVVAFKPKQIYPYHYRTPTGLSDVAKFKELVNAGDKNIDVVQIDWYPK